MKTTPWDEARREALGAAIRRIGHGERAEWLAQTSVQTALSTLSRLGWRLVPVEATEEMVEAGQTSGWRDGDHWVIEAKAAYQAMTEAGDVLKVKP